MPHHKTPEDLAQVIRSKYISDEYKPDLIAQVGEMLADPQKCLILISSKSFEDANLPIAEKWYKHNYSCDKLAGDRVENLRQAQAPDNGKALDLPPENNLIATNFDILPEDPSLSARP